MKFVCLLSCLCLSVIVNAQLPKDFRTEQIYLNLQRRNYVSGDTIIVEGQVTCLADKRFLPYSNYLYIECFNHQDSVLLRQKISCKDDGFFRTSFLADYEWPKGVYYLRAYTRLMRNFSLETFPIQYFKIAMPSVEYKGEVQCLILPSDGKLVSDNLQLVTVKLTDENLCPISEMLYLQNELGDTLGCVKSSLNGLALLRFVPRLHHSYFLTSRINGCEYRFLLPASTNERKIQGNLNGKRVSYKILNGGVSCDSCRIYSFDHKNGLLEWNVKKKDGILLLNEKPDIISLFLVNEELDVLSECTLVSKLKNDVFICMPKEINLGDTIHYELQGVSDDARIMCRVVENKDTLSANAFVSTHFLSDYKSSISFPLMAYKQGTDEFNADFYAWANTARFKRFLLKDVVVKDTAFYQYLPEQLMEFSGWIEAKTRRPMKNGTLVAYHTKKDFVYDVPLDEDGKFRMAVDDFYEGEEFFLQALTSKGKPDYANIHLDNETFPPLKNWGRLYLPLRNVGEYKVEIDTCLIKELDYFVGTDGARNFLLPNIVIKARLRKENVEPSKKFYSTNFTDRNEIEEKGYQTLYDILRDMSGITVKKINIGVDEKVWSGNSRWEIVTNRGPSLLNGGNSIPIIIDNSVFRVDEKGTVGGQELDVILSMPSFEIESVEYLRSWQSNAFLPGALNGAILVKTRNSLKGYNVPSKGMFYSPMGLSKGLASNLEMKLVAERVGSYRLIVDIITRTGVYSCEQIFQVVDSR